MHIRDVYSKDYSVRFRSIVCTVELRLLVRALVHVCKYLHIVSTHKYINIGNI